MNTRRRKTRSLRRGSTTVELALTLPILFMFVFAAIEFGRANMIRHTAMNAAYEGARAGIIPGANAATVQQTAENTLAVVGVSGTVTVTPAVIQDTDTIVTVDISIPFDANSYLAPFFLSGQNLQASCTLNREYTGF